MSELTDEQIAEKLATWMGWKLVENAWSTGPDSGDWIWPTDWRPCEIMSEAFLIQANLAQRGLSAKFVRKLVEQNWARYDNATALHFQIANATARQRCLAAIAVIENSPTHS